MISISWKSVNVADAIFHPLARLIVCRHTKRAMRGYHLHHHHHHKHAETRDTKEHR